MRRSLSLGLPAKRKIPNSVHPELPIGHGIRAPRPGGRLAMNAATVPWPGPHAAQYVVVLIFITNCWFLSVMQATRSTSSCGGIAGKAAAGDPEGALGYWLSCRRSWRIRLPLETFEWLRYRPELRPPPVPPPRRRFVDVPAPVPSAWSPPICGSVSRHRMNTLICEAVHTPRKPFKPGLIGVQN